MTRVARQLARAIFYADAGPTAGLGHVVRSCALAEALRSAGAEVIGLATVPDDAARSACASLDVPWLPWDRVYDASVACIDSYHTDAPGRERLRPRDGLLVEIADGVDRPTAADVIVDGAPGSERHVYHGPRLRATLSGPGYTLVPSYFTAARDATRADRAVVTLGSSAPGELVRAAAAGLRRALGWPIDVIVGPYTGELAVAGVTLHHAVMPPDVARLLSAARVALTSGGQTLVQAIASGTACAAIIVTDNQRDQVTALEHAGALLAMDVPDALDRVIASMTDGGAIERVVRIGRELIDGHGARRAASGILDQARLLASTAG